MKNAQEKWEGHHKEQCRHLQQQHSPADSQDLFYLLGSEYNDIDNEKHLINEAEKRTFWMTCSKMN